MRARWLVVNPMTPAQVLEFAEAYGSEAIVSVVLEVDDPTAQAVEALEQGAAENGVLLDRLSNTNAGERAVSADDPLPRPTTPGQFL